MCMLAFSLGVRLHSALGLSYPISPLVWISRGYFSTCCIPNCSLKSLGQFLEESLDLDCRPLGATDVWCLYRVWKPQSLPEIRN